MICTKCHVDKPLDCFSKTDTPKGYKSWCLACVAIRTAEWRRLKKAGLLKVKPPKVEPIDEKLSPRERVKRAEILAGRKSYVKRDEEWMNRQIKEKQC